MQTSAFSTASSTLSDGCSVRRTGRLWPYPRRTDFCSGRDVGVRGLSNRGVFGPVGQLLRMGLLAGSLLLISTAVFNLTKCGLGASHCFCRFGRVRYAAALVGHGRGSTVPDVGHCCLRRFGGRRCRGYVQSALLDDVGQVVFVSDWPVLVG